MLTPPQQFVHDSGMLDSGFNVILQFPTGGGKTYLAERAIRETMESGHRAIYLTPLRALANELFPKWTEQFQGYRTGVFTGDYGRTDSPYPVPIDQSDLLIMTPERLDACTRNWRSHWSWLCDVSLIVVDEFHLLGDENRGSRLEGTLSRFQRVNPFARLLCLSATLGNLPELGDWLEGVTHQSEWRQVPLEWKFEKFRNASSKQDIMLENVSRSVRAGGRSIVFTQSRKRAEQLSSFLVEQGIKSSFHHAGLPHDRRRKIEESFRTGDSEVLCATATLELGLNLPCRQVVLYDMQCYTSDGWKPLSVVSAWQRAGRAGRRGFDDHGEVVAIMPAWDRKTYKYEEGIFEPVLSGLSSVPRLAEQIVIEVSSGLARTRHQLANIFSGSLASFQKKLPKVLPVIETMVQAGMIVDVPDESGTGSHLKATKLGRIACRHLLSPESVLLMKSVKDREISLSFFDYLLILASSQDCGPILNVDFEELGDLSCLLSIEKSYLLQDMTVAREILGIDGKRLLSAIKHALALRCYTRVGSPEVVSDSLRCYEYEVTSAVESAERLLLAMSEVFSAEDNEESVETANGGERVAALAKMVSSGLDEALATLTLVDGIGPKYAGRLSRIGIGDIEDLANASPEDLLECKGLSQERAGAWINQAEELVKVKSAFYFHDEGPLVCPQNTEWTSPVDPYRLRRSLDLDVRTSSDCPADVLSGDEYIVSGGLDPHVVREHDGLLSCDCPDFGKGTPLCKHILATLMFRGNDDLERLAEGLIADGAQLNLTGLWGSRE